MKINKLCDVTSNQTLLSTLILFSIFECHQNNNNNVDHQNNSNAEMKPNAECERLHNELMRIELHESATENSVFISLSQAMFRFDKLDLLYLTIVSEDADHFVY